MKRYELSIRSIKKELDAAFDFYAGQENSISYHQFCGLLKSLKGDSRATAENFPNLFWKTLNPSLQPELSADVVQDFLLIVLGSFSFTPEAASFFLLNHLRKYGIAGDDLAGSTALVRLSRSYFADRIAYRPIGHFREGSLGRLNKEREENFTFKPEIHQPKCSLRDSWEDRYRTSLKKNQRILEMQRMARLCKERKEAEELLPYELKISAKKWNASKEKKLVERLSKKMTPSFKIDVAEIKAKEVQPCTHQPQLCPPPSYLHDKNVNLPKDYNETIYRLKKKWMEEIQRKEDEKKHREETDERLKKLRAQKPNPPSQLSREKKKRQVAINMDITVYPGK
eukprot:TRINITY_DN1658_c0_g1_i6.p1 TRINITY_DN1658_c0_g1~~TRINITY_DN1658_c0_g1_i6.p1  ORF type:complete len:340 (-),score=101.72 TRINITY_DN1658_c0_g1_i6:336-1355(-)